MSPQQQWQPESIGRTNRSNVMKTCKTLRDLGDISVKYPPPLLKRKNPTQLPAFCMIWKVLASQTLPTLVVSTQWYKASSQSTQLCRVQKQKPGSPENWSPWGPSPVLGTALGFDPCNVLQQQILSSSSETSQIQISCYASIQSFPYLRKKYLN